MRAATWPAGHMLATRNRKTGFIMQIIQICAAISGALDKQSRRQIGYRAS